MSWEPKTIKRPGKPLSTATETVRVVTDAGPGFLKALGNKNGPHLLAKDLIGTQLAAWLGLPTFEYALIEVTADDEIQFKNGAVQPGPAFITREQSGMTWGGDPADLKTLVNPADLGKLVLFDTWTRNCDRFRPDVDPTQKPKINRDNVFLSYEGLSGGKTRLLAMDHTHCFNCVGPLDLHLSKIDLVKEDRIYGLFPEFKPYIYPHWQTLTDAVAKLKTLDKAWVKNIVDAIPVAWQVDAAARTALATLVCNRADYMNETFIASLGASMV